MSIAAKDLRIAAKDLRLGNWVYSSVYGKEIPIVWFVLNMLTKYETYTDEITGRCRLILYERHLPTIIDYVHDVLQKGSRHHLVL